MPTAAKNEFSIVANQKKLNVFEPIGKADARSMRAEMKVRARTKFSNDLEFCQWLYHTQQTDVKSDDGIIPFYQWAGFDSWDKYVEVELGMTAGKARQMAKIHAVYGIQFKGRWDPSQPGLHISKLAQMMPVIDEENFEKMIENARNISQADFKALTAHHQFVDWCNVTYHFDPKYDRVRKRAFRMARELFGNDLTDSDIFVEILKDFIETNK